MTSILTVGEPMVMFVADDVGPLEQVERFTRSAAGAELNVSLGLQRLGYPVTYVTRLGEDPLGHYLYNLIQESGLRTLGNPWDDRFPTGFQLKSKVESGDPEVVYFRRNSAAAHLSQADIDQIDLSEQHHVHVTGIPLALSDDSQQAVFHLIERAREHHLGLTFDPNLRPSLWPDETTMVQTVNKAAQLCDLVLPGIAEGKTLTGTDDEKMIAQFYRDKGVHGVIVKLGARGTYFNVGDIEGYVPGFPVDKVVDTVGAGDGFAVGFVSGLLEKLPIEEAILRGNAIGAMQVTVPGDNEGLPTRSKLEDFLKKQKKRGLRS
jgi:2-dehydro-3-deoxygluconokinase